MLINIAFANANADYESEKIKLPAEAIEKLQINAGFGWGIFSGSIYNGNNNFKITQLTVTMTPIHDDHMEMMGMTNHDAKNYVIDLKLAPLAKSAISLAIDTDDAHIHDFEWQIIEAVGYSTK